MVVCMTNHALDSFLADLLKDGIDKLVRLGGGSKEQWTERYQPRALSHRLKGLSRNSSAWALWKDRLEGLCVQGAGICNSFNSTTIHWTAVRSHLELNYPEICRSLAEVECLSPGRTIDQAKVSQQGGGFAFEYWCNGGDLKDIESLLVSFHNILGKNEAIIQGMYKAKMQGKKGAGMDSGDVDQLKDKIVQEIVQNTEHVASDPSPSIWTMPQSERLALVAKWQDEIGIATLVDQAVELHRRHQQALRQRHQTRTDDDVHRFGQQDVIGLTTTACAKYWPLLSKLDMKTVICEEAGEVIEAHSLCTLFPSIKHAIFIGDPLQLRAQVNEQEMATENSEKYRLDQSLFERMMYPSLSSIRPFPTSRLDIQRRAHPVIADIMRATLYPTLEDAPSTKAHPRVAGMAERLYWLDHRHPENRPDPRSQFATSYANTFEADMISAMVRYLVHTNEYNFGDIAILTPYNGQLEALKQKLRGECKTFLIEKDKEALMDLRDLDLDVGDAIKTDKEGRTKFDMSKMLRLATIDNFQGEEAKIVILSLVRSNIDDRVGFLKSFNRINVACSRAKHGLYIVGNASLMQNVSMWRSIIDLLTKQHKIGGSFQACCSRHPNPRYQIRHPEAPRDPQWFVKNLVQQFFNVVTRAPVVAVTARPTRSILDAQVNVLDLVTAGTNA
ncbi:MAG: hypothetical protein Q9191_002882 [Dirinaria sp. TL-2023a]